MAVLSMTDATVLMGMFQDVERAADTLDKLREIGFSDDDITILSSVPYSHEMLGRPHTDERPPDKRPPDKRPHHTGSSSTGWGCGCSFCLRA
jgi:hypothetical protein